MAKCTHLSANRNYPPSEEKATSLNPACAPAAPDGTYSARDPVIQRVFGRSGRPRFFRVSDVLKHQDGGALPPGLEEYTGHILAETKELAVSFNDAAGSIPSRNRFNLRFLVDENLPASILALLWDRIGFATRVNTQGLRSKSDPEVLEWGRQRDRAIHAIITKDIAVHDVRNDLTALAVRDFMEGRDRPRKERNRTPTIVQIDPSIRTRDLFQALATHYVEIAQYAIDRRTPFVRLTKEGVVNGRDLLHFDYFMKSIAEQELAMG